MIENLGGGEMEQSCLRRESERERAKKILLMIKKKCLKYTGNMLKSIQTGKKRRKLTKTQAIQKVYQIWVTLMGLQESMILSE